MEIRRLVKDLQLTAIHVTHDQAEAMAISDRIAVMRKGKILQVGTPQELYLNPQHIFVANFVGESNFLEGFVTERFNPKGPSIAMIVSGGTFPLLPGWMASIGIVVPSGSTGTVIS